MFLLDTDHITLLQRKAESRLKDRIEERGALRFYVSIVSFHEQASGWITYLHKKPDRALHAYSMFERILYDFTRMQIAEFDEAALDEFNSLRAKKIRIGTLDLRIAATALSRGFTLLSGNLKDFGKVPGLRAEDWSR